MGNRKKTWECSQEGVKERKSSRLHVTFGWKALRLLLGLR
jgi:hypothetical protein